MSAHTERNTEICNRYNQGETLAALATRFSISRQRIRQIVRAAGIWKRAELRQVFLGVDVTQETKDKLADAADRKQTSMSKLASDAIEMMLGEGERS
jgi:hypothetical protein